MQILYSGKYRQRFIDLIALLDDGDRVIVELCFGDTGIASHCRKTGKIWTGYDISRSFVDRATGKGYNAFAADVSKLESLPEADACIIAGSLYHFHDALDTLIPRMLKCAPKILISEPVVNVSSRPGWVGKIAAALSNAGKGREQFRFNRESLTQLLDYYKKKYNFSYVILSRGKDILIKIAHERH